MVKSNDSELVQYIQERARELYVDGTELLVRYNLPFYLVMETAKTNLYHHSNNNAVGICSMNLAEKRLEVDCRIGDDRLTIKSQTEYRRIIDEIIQENWEKLNERYPIEIADWFVVWYEIYPEFKGTGLRMKASTLQRLLTLFFSLNRDWNFPYNNVVSFRSLIQRWQDLLYKRISKGYVQMCWENLELRRFVLDNRLNKLPDWNPHIILPGELINKIWSKQMDEDQKSGKMKVKV